MNFWMRILRCFSILRKRSTLLELHFESQGKATVNCDLSNEPFELPLSGSLEMVVKFGEEFNDDNEEVLILPPWRTSIGPFTGISMK